MGGGRPSLECTASNLFITGTDQPGTADSAKRDVQSAEEMVRYLSWCRSLNLIVVTRSAEFRFDSAFVKCLHSVQTIFGKAVWKNCVFLFTHVTDLSTEKFRLWRKSFREELLVCYSLPSCFLILSALLCACLCVSPSSALSFLAA